MFSPPFNLLRSALLALLVLIPVSPGPACAEPGPGDWKGIVPPEFEPFKLRYLSLEDFQRLLRSFGIQVRKTEFFENTLFVSFPDDENRARAVKLYRKTDVRPRRAALHFQLILAAQDPYPEYGEVSDPSLRQKIARYFDFPHYQLLDKTCVQVDSGEKGDSFLAGRYKATVKPRIQDAHTVKLDDLTVRDLDPGYNLGPSREGIEPGPTSVSDALRKTDTRLIKAKFTLTDRDTVVAGGWLLNGGRAALITVVNVQILE